jgi:hypothetical protein
VVTNEAGYFVGVISGDVFTAAVSLEFTGLSSVTDSSLPVSFNKADDNFLAESYTVTNTSLQNISITVRNSGSVA